MLGLTWTSMNIEAYLTAFHTELRRFDDMVIKIRDIVENRLTRNLALVAELELVDMAKVPPYASLGIPTPP